MSGWRRTIVPAIVVVLGGLAVWALGVDTSRLGESWHMLLWLAGESWPPEGQLWFLSAVGRGLLETLAIAYLATLFGAILSLPLALLAARNLAPTPLVVAARAIASAIRVLPSLLWAIIAVAVFGPGPLAGVVAMTLYTVGYLAKLQYEAFEGLHRDALDAVRAMGASRFQQAWHVALPEAGNALRSQILFMLEYNVRASTVVGLVGAGGIGLTLNEFLEIGGYDKVLTILLVMFITVAIMDALSLLVRRRFLEMEEGPRARWRDLLQPGKDPEPPHQ